MSASTTTNNHQTGITTTTTQINVAPRQSLVWNYFERTNLNGSLKAKCLVDECGRVLSTPHHSTSTLIRHLCDRHKISHFKVKEKLVNRSSTKPISSRLKKQLDSAAIAAIIEDGRSFGDFSKSGFTKFLQLALPNYTPPHRNLVSKQLKRLHTKHVISMIDTLANLSFMSISTDFWSDIKGTSFLVLTGHYITDEFILHSTILRFSTFLTRHYSDLIGIEIEKQLLELKLFDKVTSITCDAAPNMVKMFDYLSRSDIHRIRCQAHLIHLIVCNGLGLWIEKKQKRNTTTDENSVDPGERLSQSLNKINIIDIEETTVGEEDDDCNNGQDESQIENEDEQQHTDMNPRDTPANSSDNDDVYSVGTESDSENEIDTYEDNFQVGVSTNSNEDSNLSSVKPDPRIQIVIEKSRRLIGMIKSCSILSSFINKIKDEYNQHNVDNQIKRSLILDVRTRWNSTYKMLESLNTHRVLVNELFQHKRTLNITKKQEQRLNSFEFTSDCWYTVERLIKGLKPFYRATKMISGSDYPTIGIAFYILRRLDKEFLSVYETTDDPLLINIKKCLLDKMIHYTMIQDPSQTKNIQFYGYFDPYGISVMSSNETNAVEKEIKELFRHHQSSNDSTQSSTTTNSYTTASVTNRSSTGKNIKKKSLLDYFVDTLNGEDSKESKKPSSTVIKLLNEEFKAYKKLSAQLVSMPFDSYNPIMFWKDNQFLLPNLATLARKYLASPGTSTKAESAFSISAYYGRKQRARLSSDNLTYSVFLKDKL